MLRRHPPRGRGQSESYKLRFRPGSYRWGLRTLHRGRGVRMVLVILFILAVTLLVVSLYLLATAGWPAPRG